MHLDAQRGVDGSAAKTTSRSFRECGSCAAFPGWWRPSQVVFGTLVGVGLRKSVLPLFFLKFPWANTPNFHRILADRKRISFWLFACGLAQYVTVPSDGSFRALWPGSSGVLPAKGKFCAWGLELERAREAVGAVPASWVGGRGNSGQL